MTDPGNDYLPPSMPPEAEYLDPERFIPEYLIAPSPEVPPAVPAAPTVVVVPETAPADDERAKVNAAIAKATAGGLAGMSPADRIAALSAIRDAIDARVTWEKSTIVENLLGATSAKSIPSQLGDLSYRPPSRPTKIDEDKLLAFVQENHPDAVTERTVVVHEIDPAVRKQLVDAVIHVGDGDFALSTTGEPIDFAYLGNETSATVSYPASAVQKIVKAQARAALDDHFLLLTSGMLDAAAGQGK